MKESLISILSCGVFLLIGAVGGHFEGKASTYEKMVQPGWPIEQLAENIKPPKKGP